MNLIGVVGGELYLVEDWVEVSVFMSFDVIVDCGFLFYRCLVVLDELFLLSYEEVIRVFIEDIVGIWLKVLY